ncbi:hypothetical protein BQ8794_50612 [Mesorhizobium prunaredense]|uniref:Uncharacterized protein n=1 Tax=Mesorhizobium prunaredense TaxID=1631249 RepID=A0A1R3VF19_9HYPH|nr:hypothetical protein BQ8794_50612 [Mesorhizobium prunaredense]
MLPPHSAGAAGPRPVDRNQSGHREAALRPVGCDHSLLSGLRPCSGLTRAGRLHPNLATYGRPQGICSVSVFFRLGFLQTLTLKSQNVACATVEWLFSGIKRLLANVWNQARSGHSLHARHRSPRGQNGIPFRVPSARF